MAVEYFLKLDGIDGESKAQGHTGEIDIMSFSWGLTQTGGGHIGGGSGKGKVDVHDISLSKYVDKASCKLMAACCAGQHIPNGLITAREAGGDSPVEFLKITLNQVLISSYQTGGGTGDSKNSESVSLNFAKFKVEYQEQGADGTGKPAGNMTWDVTKNSKG